MVREAIILQVPWICAKTPCPVKDSNRDEWTALEREKGQDRLIPKDLRGLKKMVCLYLFILLLSLMVLAT